MQLYKTILITLLSFLLFACGGSLDGAESSTDSSDSSETDTSTTYNLSLSISTTAVSDANPAIISATVTDDDGAIEGQVVTFSSSYGVFNPASGTALTNSDGIAYIGLTAGAVAGAGVVTATMSSGETSTIGFSTAGDASESGSKTVTVTVVNDQISALSPSQVSATVTENGDVVAGELVQFTTTSGLLSPTSGTALTDDQGIATITLTAGTVEGAGTITATLINGEYATDNFATAGDESSSTGKSIVVTQITETVEDANPVTVIVTVTENGASLANEVVSFTSTFGDFNPTSGTALTNSSGVASIVLTAGDIAGAGIVTASLSSGEFDSSGFVTTGDSTSDSSSIVVKLDSIDPISNASPAIITVWVTENGSGVANEVVNFSSSLGVFDPVSGTALTDSTGKATIELTAGSIEGAGIVTASISGGEFDSTGFSTAGDAPLVTGNAVSLTISTTSVSDATPATLTATVTGDDVANQVVNFGATLGTLSPLSGTALTDATGVATITLTAGDVAGAGVASATLDNSAKASVNFETAGDETDSSLKDIVLSMDVTSISAASPSTVTATITDSDGNAVAGEVVEFSASIGVLNPVSGTALTNASGIATISLTAGDTAGAGLVQVSLTSGEENSVGFTTAGDATASSSKVVTLDAIASAITDASPATITATVVDGNGDAIVGEVVNFSSSLGVLDPVSGTALTDENGEATITLTTGDVAGAGLLSASLSSGELDSTGFTTAGDAPLVTGNAVSLTISTTSVSDATPATLTATVTGDDVANQVVNFGATLGTLSPLSGTALTDATGVATITLTAGDVAGAGVASATLDNSAKASVNFETAGDETDSSLKDIVLSMDVTSISAASPSTVTATITDSDGNAVAGEVVEFSASIGVLNPVSGTALTNASGIATISLTAGDTAGAGLVQVSLTSGEENSVGFTTAGDATASSSKVVTLDAIASAITDASPATITATVVDGNGDAIVGEVVNFSSSLGVLDPVSGTALTDENGEATITLTTGDVAGAGLLSASLSSGELDSTGFTTAGDAPLVTGNAVSLTISTTSVSDATPATLTATVTGDDVANQVVNFGATLGTLSPLSGTALTDATGVATITLTAGDVAGAGVASATLDNSAKASVNFETAGDETDSSLKDIVLSMDVTSISAASPSTVTSTITDSDGNAVAGEVVEFSASIGVLNPVSGTALTNASGIATISLTAGDTAGAGLVQVSLTSGEENSVGFTTAGDATASSSKVVTLDAIASAITDASPATITATVVDGNGDAIVGEVVNFSSSLGVLDPVSGTALTDENGEATITLTTGDVAGAGLLSASLSSGELDSTGFTTAGDAPLVAGNAVSLSISTTSVSDATPATLTATVTDASGALVSGEVVNFGATLGTLSPLSGTALTNASGVATITLTAGDVAGAGVTTVTLDNGANASVSFETKGDNTNASGNIVSLSIDNSSIDASNSATLTVVVTNNGVPVVGEVVSFASELGSFLLDIPAALTDSDGKGTITLTAGDQSGAGIVTATLSNGAFDTIGFETAGDEVTDSTTITVDLKLVTPDTTDEIDSINTLNPGQLIATVTGIDSPVIVTFTSDIGEIPIPTAITDETSFEAIVDIYAGSTLGAGTVTATLKDGEIGELIFVVGASDLKMGSGSPFVEGEASLTLDSISAGGTTVVSVDIVDENGDLYTSPVDVLFSSSCVDAETATISSSVTSNGGTASSTYLAKGCVGEDPITVSANAGGVSLSASTSVTVEAASAGSIEFVSVSPESLSLKGIGGIESSTIVFKVLDTEGLAAANKVVSFELNTNSGGITLSQESATSDDEGLVQTVITAGTVATPVRVFASLDENSNIATQSSMLVISTGIPDQDSFSVSASVLNPEAWDIDGVTSEITVRLADAFNNPAPDDTAVSFTTEGGSIEPFCTTTDGTCTVTWTSQSPRPTNGRVSILAFAVGEESFPDFNGNGRFDAGDEVDAFKGDNGFDGNDVEGDKYDLPEAFVDHNEDNIYNPTANGGSWDGVVEGQNEEYYDFVAKDDSGNIIGEGNEFVYDPADRFYNGSLCNITDTDGNAIVPHAGCSEQKSIHVRGDVVIVMSGSDATFEVVNTEDGHDTINDSTDSVVNITGENSGSATIRIYDLHEQPMPQGTTVTFSTETGSIVGTSSFTWPNENTDYESIDSGKNFSVVIKGDEDAATGPLFVEVTTPGGSTSTYSDITISISAP